VVSGVSGPQQSHPASVRVMLLINGHVKLFISELSTGGAISDSAFINELSTGGVIGDSASGCDHTTSAHTTLWRRFS
jgi:hypothetical protein